MTAPGDDRGGEILDARARKLAQPSRDDVAPGGADLLVMWVGDAKLAVDIQRVRQVLPPAALARVPGRDHFVVGLRNVGGELLAIADIAALIGLSSGRTIEARWVVVVDGHGGPIGILVDRAAEIVSDTAMTPPRHRSEGSLGLSGVIAATTGAGHLLIDADTLLAHSALRVGTLHEATIYEEDTI